MFDHLNAAYANPNVWMTYSRSMGYPDFEISEEGAFSDDYLIEKKFREDKVVAGESLRKVRTS